MNTCPVTRKIQHLTAQACWAVIRLTEKRHRHTQKHKAHRYAYLCADCHCWHITSRHNRDHPADWQQRRQFSLKMEARA